MKNRMVQLHLLPSLLLLLLATVSSFTYGKEIWRNIDKIVAIGDVHGDYDQYLAILKDNKLIDSKLNWVGGKTHLVQLGDIPDRGPDSLKVMRHMEKLQKQARRKRGFVHALLGNHEVMNVAGDLRYVHPGEYTILKTKKSKRLQQDYITRVIAYLDSQDPLSLITGESRRTELENTYPLGYVEHRLLWAPKGEFFDWVKNNNTVIKINRTLFVHGGLSPHQAPIALKEINNRVRKYLKHQTEDPIVDTEGPLWYRGLAQHPEETELEPLIAMLKYYDADTIVVAHTPTPSRILPRMGRRVIQADVGLSRAYSGGRASLMIEEGEYFALHRGEKVALPTDKKGTEEYLERISRIDKRITKNTEEK